MTELILEFLLIVLLYQIVVPDSWLDNVLQSKFPSIVKRKNKIFEAMGKSLTIVFLIFAILFILVVTVLIVKRIF